MFVCEIEQSVKAFGVITETDEKRPSWEKLRRKHSEKYESRRPKKEKEEEEVEEDVDEADRTTDTTNGVRTIYI